MTPRTRARNPNELTGIANQAIDEVEDLRVVNEYYEELKVASSLIVESAATGLTLAGGC